MSGVLQGPILESILFDIFTSYIDSGLEHTLTKFADNTELSGGELGVICWCALGKQCQPEGPWQAWEMSTHEPHEVLQVQVQDPTPVSGQS